VSTKSPYINKPRPRVVTLILFTAAFGFFLVLAMLISPYFIPNTRDPVPKANEPTAIQSIKNINVAEAAYHLNYPQHGFACSLPALAQSDRTPPDTPPPIDDKLLTTVKAGYTFKITCGAKTIVDSMEQYSRYTITAVPNKVGQTGHRGFCSDQDGNITFDPKGGTACTQVLQ
jgi:type IV pilus assembly protein PilA